MFIVSIENIQSVLIFSCFQTLRMAFMFLTGISSYLVALAVLGQDGRNTR